MLGKLPNIGDVLPFLLLFFPFSKRSFPGPGLNGRVVRQRHLVRISKGRGLRKITGPKITRPLELSHH